MDKVKEIIGIEKFDDTKIFIDKSWIARLYYFKKCCDINDMCYKRYDKFYPQLFLEEVLLEV